MTIDTESPINQGVLKYYGRVGKPESPVLAAPDSVRDAYLCQGSHPDIVQRVWDELGKGIPSKCRRLVYGTPALVHNRTGVVIATCNGTQYNLRLTADDFQTAIAKGARIINRWSNGTEMNSLEVLGTGWIFGGWFKEEEQWLLNTYEQYSTPRS